MTTRILPSALVLAAAATGCSSAASMSNGGNGGAGGASSADAGGVIVKLDAAGAASSDASPAFDGLGPGQVPVSLSTDAPVFRWGDSGTCQNCGIDGGAAVDSATAMGGAGGGTGAGGSTGSGSGGAIGLGGATSAGTGGSAGAGGAMSQDAATSPRDAGIGGDLPVSLDASPMSDASVLPPSDAFPDVATSDSYSPPPDTSSRCLAQLRSLVPSTDSLDLFPLVAAASTQVVLRAEILSGGPTFPTWTWQASRDGIPVTPSRGQQDQAAAAFPITTAGTYTFMARENASLCSATTHVYAYPPNPCPDCDRSVMLRAAPPPTGNIPVQSGAMGLTGGTPFSQRNIVLAKGVPVLISPSVGSSLVSSYIRINRPAGDLVADGLADPKAGFAALLLAMDPSRALLSYDVLVVPIDGAQGGTVAATAPQLYQGYTADQLRTLPLVLTGGLAVTGSTTSSTGQTVADARVILSNRNPSALSLPSDLIFSSVGRTDAQGNYVLHAQPGSYWVSISPPPGSGLAEALAPAPITLGASTTISFRWNAIATASLALDVLDASGNRIDDAHVRLTSAQATTIGSLTVGSGPAQPTQGNVRVEGTTVAGAVTFTNLPSGVAYDVLIVPPVLGTYAATTLVNVVVPANGGTQTVQVLPQARIGGMLVAATGGATDWSKVNVFAYDHSVDSPEAPQAVSVNPDGSFTLGVSPARPYVLLAVPDTSTRLARTFVGPGPVEASEFTITQKVQASMAWIAEVMDEDGNTLSGTALQVFCGDNWPYCVDSTIPLAETTSGSGGAFQLALPDPATR